MPQNELGQCDHSETQIDCIGHDEYECVCLECGKTLAHWVEETNQED